MATRRKSSREGGGQSFGYPTNPSAKPNAYKSSMFVAKYLLSDVPMAVAMVYAEEVEKAG